MERRKVEGGKGKVEGRDGRRGKEKWEELEKGKVEGDREQKVSLMRLGFTLISNP